MRRNNSSRHHFPADDSRSRASHSENPAGQQQRMRNQHFSLPSPRHSLLIQFICFSVLCLVICCLIYFLHGTLLWIILAIVVVLFVAYFVFKTGSRIILWLLLKKEGIFLHIDGMYTKTTNNGLGVECFDEGTYRGEFQNGTRNGTGLLEIPEVCTYQGDWVNGLYDGYGVEILAGHGLYIGQFSKGVRSGYGYMKFFNGDCYNGEWLNGHRTGIGKQTYNRRDMYIGQLKGGMKHGLGAYYLRNGDTYIGEYFNNMPLGFGTYIWSSGDTYEGSWHENLMEGYGAYSKKTDGEVKSGKWVKGDLTVVMPTTEPDVVNAVQV